MFMCWISQLYQVFASGFKSMMVVTGDRKGKISSLLDKMMMYNNTHDLNQNIHKN